MPILTMPLWFIAASATNHSKPPGMVLRNDVRSTAQELGSGMFMALQARISSLLPSAAAPKRVILFNIAQNIGHPPTLE